jgi:hypothetical protein
MGTITKNYIIIVLFEKIIMKKDCHHLKHHCHHHPGVLIGEATNTNFIVFGLTRPGLEPTIYRTPDEHNNHYATDAVVSEEKINGDS